ncbi:MAG: hypothetical protein B6D71_06945, partial [gamma proteobacterium symbiont of Stewartia floridana]
AGLSKSLVINGQSLSPQLSIGSSVYPKDAEGSEELLRFAQANHGINLQSKQRHLAQSSNWIKLIKNQS